MNLSYQLYSSRSETDLNAVLAHLAATGYTQVEGFGGVFGDPAGLRKEMDRLGLAMPSAHFGLDMLESNLDKALSVAMTLGIDTLYAPHIAEDDRPVDVAGWQAFADRLGAIGAKVRAAGFSFGWHNHDFEFVALEDGSTPMEIILERVPELEWEADIAWVVRGKADAVAWIEKYASRITSVHIKDIAPEGENTDEDGWADVGEGTVPWAELLTTLSAAPVRTFVMEHDKPADTRRFAERSFTNVQKMGG